MGVNIVEWIPIKKKLPPKDKVILCTGVKGGLFLGQYVGTHNSCVSGLNGHHVAKQIGMHYGNRTVLAWMLAPEPYVDEEATAEFQKILYAYNHRFASRRKPR